MTTDYDYGQGGYGEGGYGGLGTQTKRGAAIAGVRSVGVASDRDERSLIRTAAVGTGTATPTRTESRGARLRIPVAQSVGVVTTATRAATLGVSASVTTIASDRDDQLGAAVAVVGRPVASLTQTESRSLSLAATADTAASVTPVEYGYGEGGYGEHGYGGFGSQQKAATVVAATTAPVTANAREETGGVAVTVATTIASTQSQDETRTVQVVIVPSLKAGMTPTGTEPPTRRLTDGPAATVVYVQPRGISYYDE